MRDDSYLREAAGEDLLAAAGAYRLHRACIELSADFPVFSDVAQRLDELEVDPGFALFVHEYAHFLQNFGTVAGLAELIVWSNILAAYSRTISSPTAEVLAPPSEDDAALVSECWQHLGTLQGTKSVPNAGRLSFQRARVESEEITLRGRKISRLQALLEFHTPSNATVSVRAGTFLLYEGLAFALESWVSDADQSQAAGLGPPPFYPYEVLQEVASGYGVQHRFVFAAMATLALNTGSPWPTLLDLFERYRVAAPDPAQIHAYIAGEATRLKPERDGLIHVLLDDDLPALREMFSRRGAVEVGMASLIDDANALLRRRLNEPLFEMAPFTRNALDLSRLRSLLLRHPPCDVLQRHPGHPDAVARDELFSFRPHDPNATVSYSEGVRAVEGQMWNMMAHVGGGSILLTSALQYRRACPFFEACTLRRRQDHEEVCKDRPWSHYEREPARTCWYSAGVAGTIGEVNVIQVLRDADQ